MKREIEIIDGSEESSYFSIMPVRILNFENTGFSLNVDEMHGVMISIEEEDVFWYLTPFLKKHFDNELEANRKRVECWRKENGKEVPYYLSDFEWYLTYNFYTFEAIERTISDIEYTAKALTEGRDNEFTLTIKENPCIAEAEAIIDFYDRVVFRLRHMMRVGKENGYDLISFMGP